MKIKKQNDIKDCGVMVIQALHKHFHDRWIDVNELKENANYGSSGINIKSLIDLGNRYGLSLYGYEADADSITKEASQYFIALIRSNGMQHYVIVRWVKDMFEVYDSTKGFYKLTKSEFENVYSNCIITIEKKEYKKEVKDITSPFKYIAKSPEIIIWILIAIILSIIITFISTAFLKIIIDKVIPMRKNNLLNLVIVSFTSIACIKVMITTFKTYLIKKMCIKIETDLSYKYVEKILNINFKNSNKLTQSDNLRRMSLIHEVSNFIANGLFIIFNEMIMFAISAAVLIWLSPSLFGLSFLAASAISIFTIFFRYLLKSKYDDSIKYQIKLFESMSDISKMIFESKELKVKNHLSGTFDKSFTQQQTNSFAIWKINKMQTVFETLINSIIPIFITYFGTKLIFKTELSIGSMVMFITIFHNFIDPIKDMCDIVISFPLMKKNIDLISFVINMNEEEKKKGIIPSNIKNIKLSNFIVSYDKDILKIDDFEIKHSILIKGKNGSGKSTFLKSIAMRLTTRGSIEYNGDPIQQLDVERFRDDIAFIGQDTYMNNLSIIEYITLRKPEAIKRFMSNYKKFNLNTIFDDIGLSLNSRLNNNAENISSGQKQIIRMMRLFAFNYKLIILDEALENIDKNNFNKIKGALNKLYDCIFLEVSHSGKTIASKKEVNIEQINKYK